MPEKVSLKTGLANLAWSFANYPRYASGIVWEDKASVLPLSCPDAVAFWAVFQPMFEQLFAPFELRGRLSGHQERRGPAGDLGRAVDAIVAALGLELGDELAVMRYGAGWGSLRGPEQLAAKQRLLDCPGQPGEHRPRCELPGLIAGAAARALLRQSQRRHGPAQVGADQAAGEDPERVLRGDWLGFLRYIGETPHPDEEIATAIPGPELFVGGTKDASVVASDLGLRPTRCSEPGDLLGQCRGALLRPSHRSKSVWSPSRPTGRVRRIHACQAPGMKPLYGLMEFAVRRHGLLTDTRGRPLQPALLPRPPEPRTPDDIERLWGSTMLARWPSASSPRCRPMLRCLRPSVRRCGSGMRSPSRWYISEGPLRGDRHGGVAGPTCVDLEDAQDARLPYRSGHVHRVDRGRSQARTRRAR